MTVSTFLWAFALNCALGLWLDAALPGPRAPSRLGRYATILLAPTIVSAMYGAALAEQLWRRLIGR